MVPFIFCFTIGVWLLQQQAALPEQLPSVMQAMPISWLSSSWPDSHPLLQLARDKRRSIDGQSWQWDGVDFEMLHPNTASYDTA